MSKYNYRSQDHRTWAAEVKLENKGRGCVICGRGAEPKRKGQKLHAHHVFGTNHRKGAVLCPTCHRLETLLTGPAKAVFLNKGKWRRLLHFVRLRLDGPANGCPGGKDCICD